MKIAVLDDYQKVALQMADWSELEKQAAITVFHHHLADEAAVIARLSPFHVICAMRERTPLTRSIIQQLPNLKLIVSTGKRNASIDADAAQEYGVEIKFTGYLETGAPEITWALLMALAKNIVTENNNITTGGWQTTIGTDLDGKTIGIIGLGRVGTKVATYAKAFGMNVIAWSQNLTAEKAEAAGAKLVTKDELFKQADFVTIHLVLSQRTKGIVDFSSLSLMKPTAYFINTSRGPLVNETDLIKILQQNLIKGAAVDVFDTEPLTTTHPLRSVPNLLATPHIGYVTQNTYKLFYKDTVDAILDWMA